MSTPQSMPTKLIVVLVLLCLSLASDLYNLGGETSSATDYIRIVLNLGLLYGLLRGQEWARVLAKVTAVLSLVGGGLLLIPALMLGSLAFAVPELGILLFASIGLMLVYGGFLLWTMNQIDVQEWLAARKSQDVK